VDLSAAFPVVAAKLRIPRAVGLPRQRLDDLLAPLWQRRLTLVVAPAGAGKTTLLAQVAAGAQAPVAWYRAEPSDSDPRALLACLESALTPVLDGVPGGWTSVEVATAALERWRGSQALLVVDDLHALHDSPAEHELERLLAYLPSGLVLLAASRATPSFNLSRMRVADELLEIGADDLRFRSWEVERLFRDVYREPLAPEDLAELTRRTDGWAAGLQLFHLATEGRRHDERRRILAGLNTPARFVREYLAGNVIDHLPARLRTFLVDTCVLGRMSGPLCDAFLGRSGSGEVLDELERRQIFTFALDENGWFRYHEVLRSHLQATLVDAVGEEQVRARHARAGAVLEEWGALHDALVAYCRGEDWEAVARLLGHDGELLSLDPGTWLDLLPPGLLEQDPWVLLATARRLRGMGRWQAAVAVYRRAEGAFSDRAARALCRREQRAVAVWQGPVLVPAGDWLGIVRAATIRDPLVAHVRALELPGAGAQLAAGLAALLAGHVQDARRLFERAMAADGASPMLELGARIAAAAAALLAGDRAAGAAVDATADEAEQLGARWLAAVARALLTLSDRPGGRSEAALLRLAAQRTEDPWGEHLAALLEGLAAAPTGLERTDRLEAAAAAFAALGAGVLEVWCLAVRALALAARGAGSAPAEAKTADGRARALGVPGARLLAARALALAEPDRAEDHRRLATALAAECGVDPQLDQPNPHAAAGTPSPQVILQMFGGFRLELGGRAVELASVRPRARAVLRLLALRPGRAVHREAIIAALWPEADLDGGARHLHVAVSSLRRVLPDPVEIRRDGDAYRLELPAAAVVDTDEFDRQLGLSRDALVNGDGERAARLLDQALHLHEDGELLPEDGPAEWVVGPREHYRAEAVQAASELAAFQLRHGEALQAATTCERGLRIDRYRDNLWRTLVAAYEAAGDRAAAAHARQRYDEMLAALGVAPGHDVLVDQPAVFSASS
jgi:DNA-binding SARP family transcriptional activator